MKHDHNLCTACSAAMRDGGLELDWERREFRRGGVVVRMTRSETDIAHVLYNRLGFWTPPAKIIYGVYGAFGNAEDQMACIRVFIHRLNCKLERASIRVKVVNDRYGSASRGYKLEIA